MLLEGEARRKKAQEFNIYKVYISTYIGLTYSLLPNATYFGKRGKEGWVGWNEVGKGGKERSGVGIKEENEVGMKVEMGMKKKE